MGEVQNGTAWSLVYASAFHSDKAIFDNVHPTNTMLAAELIQRGKDKIAGEFLTQIFNDALGRTSTERFLG